MGIEWRYPSYSKTALSHAYPANSDSNAMPLCGFGSIRRSTRLEKDCRRKSYRLVRCPLCAVMCQVC